jgi:tRNA (guanine26-N2/guanine27-N2)-dimethyltransferase
MTLIQEHSMKITATLEKDPHKKMEVFYNPVMISNRNISILLLNSIDNKDMILADPLAGSGIRSLRFLKELKKNKINQIYLNDNKENFAKTIKDNLTLNKIKTQKLQLRNQDANDFLLNQHQDDFCGYFDYIDIDSFGTPNPFLSAAVNKIKRKGILAVTATDTAALTGTYPKVTKRKYWAKSIKTYMMHETGLRILIRKIQLLGVQFDKALTPILAYYKDHYFRIYFRSETGKEKCDTIIEQHKFFLYCPRCLNFRTSNFNQEVCKCKKRFEFMGPMWAGNLCDKKLIRRMARNNPYPEEQKFLDLMAGESTKDSVGFIDLHVMAKKTKVEPTKMQPSLNKLKGVRTHFSPNGIKTNRY